MYLETENPKNIKHARNIRYNDITEAQMLELIRDRKQRGGFAILASDDDHYIQAFENGDNDWCLEYRDGGNHQHFEIVGECDQAKVEQVFVWYLNNDDRWRTESVWRQMDFTSQKPWWKFW